jgi:hypothetical protein
MKKNVLFLFYLLMLASISHAQWNTNGTHIYNSNAGNVGIGNNTPGTLLHVAKNMTEPAITVQNLGGAGGATYSMVDNISGANWKFKVTSTGGFKIRDHAFGLDVFTIEANSSANAFYINSAGNIGLGTNIPVTRLDIVGGNNWDLVSGEGDLRLGNSLYRIKMGIALDGGGAGAAGIMQYGQPGGYNVLKLGAQGNYVLFINGSTQRVGIGTDNPGAKLDIQGTVRIADGTQGAGKVLTSDASGTASWSSSSAHFIGESYGGGKVFYVYDNGQHGLIAATTDQSPGIQWYNGSNTTTNSVRDQVNAGSFNTERIIINQGAGGYAAQICANYQGGGFGDWYLPSKSELNLLYLQKDIIGGFGTNAYWSSGEYNFTDANYQYFVDGTQFYAYKYYAFAVRAIRAF